MPKAANPTEARPTLKPKALHWILALAQGNAIFKVPFSCSMQLHFSIIVPVYNRPQELQELLQSLQLQEFDIPFEVVVVEDGSTQQAAEVVQAFRQQLHIAYYYKENSGPGDSRNYGMQRAKGNYFIFLDSDCILPPHYLTQVYQALQREFVPCFGGPDAAAPCFTHTQKAINHAMTSFWTTGGIRGGEKAVGTFQPRSFNMGIAKEVYERVGGFGPLHPGEDVDFTFRIWKAGYPSKCFAKAFVYHKRRVGWRSFYTQVKKFGQVRPILNQWHPGTARLTYWFPTLFTAGLLLALLLALAGVLLPLGLYGGYFLLLCVEACLKNKSPSVGLLTVFAAVVQFVGYGTGFVTTTLLLGLSRRAPEKLFPHLFFASKQKEGVPASGRNTSKLKVFSLFLLGAFLAWLLSNLSELYQASATFNLTYSKVPDTLVLGKNAVSTLQAKLNASGFRLLYYRLLPKHITIDVSQTLHQNGRYLFPQAVLQRALERQLSQNASLLAIEGTPLFVDVYPVTAKRVAVAPNITLSFRQNHVLAGALNTAPTHVTVKGPRHEVDTLTAISTAPVVLEGLSSHFSQQLSLVLPPPLENSSLSTSTVTLSGEVVAFSERMIDVPIQTVNAPAGYRVKTFPHTVPVRCKATLPRLKALTPADFTVIADYQQRSGSEADTLLLQLAQKPPNVYEVALLTNTVTFILEKL